MIIILIIAFLISIISLFVNACAWKLLINWLGYKKRDDELIDLYLRTNLLKYLPGGIWHFVERFRSLKSSIPSSQAFSFVLLEPFLMLSAALSLTAICNLSRTPFLLFFIPLFFLARRWRAYLIMQLGAVKLLEFKKLGEKLSFTRESIRSWNPISPYPIHAVLVELLFILFRFAGFWFCLKAFSIENIFGVFEWISLFSLSWSIGLVVPSAPGGIGVFESFLLLITRGEVPEDYILLALLSYRLIVSLADIFVHLPFQFKTKLI
ncbi:putative transmembrane protein HieC [Prochlorococcus sp. MIT 0602]|nr:putative transmembrane protein HieC [Prochlorococcus sp. MIT 0602]KGG17055.1 putative transmembrane protein HieC [Prochlorococcus sp. MIT 0603]